MNSSVLSRLQQAGALRAVDVELARLIVRLDGRGDDALALATASASLAIAQGHSCLPLAALGDVLGAAVREPLRIALPDIEALRTALASSPLVAPALGTPATPLVFDGERLWLRRYFDYERRVSAGLRARAQSRCADVDPAALRARLARWLAPRRDGIDWQAIAIALGARQRLCVIGGGPGTGKTTTVLWLLAALLEQAAARGETLPRIRLAAPTGKAAARLGESIRTRKATLDGDASIRDAIREDGASTIHRLLGYRPHGGFRHDRANPLAADIVVVDEASMIDLPLMAHLLDGLRDDASLILLGDVGQLASVETGHVLASIAAGDERIRGYSAETADYLRAATGFDVPVRTHSPAALADVFVELQHSHRFGRGSGIGRLAAAIRSGDADATMHGLGDAAADVHWQRGDAATLAEAARDEWAARYATIAQATSAASALDLATGFRVLTAVREGPCGCIALNRTIETTLGDGATWYHGRLVIVTANDYRHGLFNGDVGVAFAGADGRLDVWFPGEHDELRAFAPYTLPAHEGAFAMTVHKSQGSEFDQVVVVLPDAPNRVLGRELLYTAVTRARDRVTVWGEEAIVRATIARRIERYSGLPLLLHES